jgi:hypothetical protein
LVIWSLSRAWTHRITREPQTNSILLLLGDDRTNNETDRWWSASKGVKLQPSRKRQWFLGIFENCQANGRNWCSVLFPSVKSLRLEAMLVEKNSSKIMKSLLQRQAQRSSCSLQT